MNPVDNSHSFAPTTSVQWLTLADRLQLERDLTDLPELADILDRNYHQLLAQGDRDPDDRAIRYPTRMDVLDLADRRTKWERSADRTEPLTLNDRGIHDPSIDPAWWADMARRLGNRRQGILPTITSWVSLAVGEMHDTGTWHTQPTDPDRIVWQVGPDAIAHPTKPGPTVASETAWLTHHLEWITTQQWSIDLAAELRTIIRDLEQLGIDYTAANQHACLTADQIADIEPISRSTIYRWWNQGLLTDVGKIDRKRVFVLHEVRTLIARPPNDQTREA
jgi:hypothetical protein